MNANFTMIAYGIVTASAVDSVFTISFQIMRKKDLNKHMLALFVLNILMGVLIVFFYFPWMLYASVMEGKYWNKEIAYFKIGVLVWICESVAIFLFTSIFVAVTIFKGPTARRTPVIMSK
jgi:hypothetical protein